MHFSLFGYRLSELNLTTVIRRKQCFRSIVVIDLAHRVEHQPGIDNLAAPFDRFQCDSFRFKQNFKKLYGSHWLKSKLMEKRILNDSKWLIAKFS